MIHLQSAPHSSFFTSKTELTSALCSKSRQHSLTATQWMWASIRRTTPIGALLRSHLHRAMDRALFIIDTRKLINRVICPKQHRYPGKMHNGYMYTRVGPLRRIAPGTSSHYIICQKSAWQLFTVAHPNVHLVYLLCTRYLRYFVSAVWHHSYHSFMALQLFYVCHLGLCDS